MKEEDSIYSSMSNYYVILHTLGFIREVKE